MTADVKSMNIKNRIYYFLDAMIDIQAHYKLTKYPTKTLKFIALDTSQLKKMMIIIIFTV